MLNELEEFKVYTTLVRYEVSRKVTLHSWAGSPLNPC